MLKLNKQDVEHALAYLRDALKPGTRVYTQVVHVARSGMSRDVRVYFVNAQAEIEEITGFVRNACGLARSRSDRFSISVGGCGFNAGLEVADVLNHKLFGEMAKPLGQRAYLLQGREEPLRAVNKDPTRFPGLRWSEMS